LPFPIITTALVLILLAATTFKATAKPTLPFIEMEFGIYYVRSKVSAQCSLALQPTDQFLRHSFRKNKRRGENHAAPNKSLDVRAKQRLCYCVVR